MARLLLSAVLAVVFPGQALATAVRVTVVAGAPGLTPPAAGEVVISTEAGPAVRTPFSGPGDLVALERPERAIAISADVPEMWCAPRSVTPEGEDQAVVEVPCWPAGTVKGTITFAEKGNAASEVAVRLQVVTGATDRGLPASVTTTARIEGGRWEAKVPAGRFDLSLRPRSFIPQYLWNVSVEARTTTDLGTRSFRSGTSLIGTVEAGGGARLKPEECAVRLRPQLGAERGQDAGRSHLLARTVRPNARGFFQFEGVGPGRWELVATQAGLAEATRVVDLVEGMESAMNPPLVLAPFASIELRVDPPHDPEGESWGIEVAEVSPGAGGQRVVESRARTDGTWRFDRMIEGRSYVVLLKTGAGVGWWTDPEPFKMGPVSQKRTIHTEIERIRGMVRLGKNPLAATITFGGEGHATAVRFESDSTGRFEGALPRRGAFQATVRSAAPTVHRTVDVDVPDPGDDGAAEVDIHLPETAVQGEILDEGGNRVPKAWLRIRGLSRRDTMVEAVSEGTFLLAGLLDGEYLVSGEAADLESDSYPLRLSRDEEPEPLRIVLHPLRAIKGRTVNRAGSGIPRASVQRLPEPAAESTGQGFPPADLEGRWRARTLATRGAACLLLASPGFSSRILKLEALPTEQEIVLDQSGGRLALRARKTTLGDPFPVLFHGGCLSYARALPPYGVATVTEEKGNLRIEGAFESGEYSLCMLTHEEFRAYPGGRPAFPSCAHGVLPSSGSLELTAPDR